MLCEWLSLRLFVIEDWMVVIVLCPQLQPNIGLGRALGRRGDRRGGPEGVFGSLLIISFCFYLFQSFPPSPRSTHFHFLLLHPKQTAAHKVKTHRFPPQAARTFCRNMSIFCTLIKDKEEEKEERRIHLLPLCFFVPVLGFGLD
jgi:hypothetical protein